MGLDVSTRTIRQVLSHFQTHGTIPEHSNSAEKKGYKGEKKPNRHLRDVDVEVCEKLVRLAYSDATSQFLLGAIQKSPNSYLDELQEMLALSCGVQVSCATIW